MTATIDTRETTWNYSAAELANLRALTCPECGERGCTHIECDRCNRHAENVIEVNGHARIICGRCSVTVECASCSKRLPRWQTANIEGEAFCPECAHCDPLENW